MGLPTIAGNAGQAINQISKKVWMSLEKARPSAVELLNQVKTGVPGYMMIIPLLIVLVVAIKGLPTLACLFGTWNSGFTNPWTCSRNGKSHYYYLL